MSSLHQHRQPYVLAPLSDFPPPHLQACVRNVKPSERVQTFDTGGGASLQLSSTEFKPWLSLSDGENVFFGSIHVRSCETRTD